MVQRCDAAYKQIVLLKCYDALAAAGFTRFRKEGVDWPLENGFHCWVGLNTALFDTHVEINPFVGVHVVPIMKLYTSLEGRKYSRTIATYALHMGLLASEESAFHFVQQMDVAAQTARLAKLCATVGLSYARSIASYERLLPLLQEHVEMLGAYPERVACCLYLMGRKDEARSFTETFLAQHRDYFEGFAVPFMEMLDREPVVYQVVEKPGFETEFALAQRLSADSGPSRPVIPAHAGPAFRSMPATLSG